MPTYAVVTPARNEGENLRRLADCLVAQEIPPVAWVIVDDGSTDDTESTARELERRIPWASVLALDGARSTPRGAPVARAFQAGLRTLETPTDVVVKLDADLSFEPGYFRILLAAFDGNPSLGMASGSCWEQQADGRWEQQHVTGDSVWGASRAYRRACLDEVLPLEEFMGWDGIDQVKANVRGWRTATLVNLPFQHHRREGARDGSRRRAWEAQGHAAYYMGYRWWYVAARSLRWSIREPAAAALFSTYLEAQFRHEKRCTDDAVIQHVRRGQTLRALPMRAAEALGSRGGFAFRRRRADA